MFPFFFEAETERVRGGARIPVARIGQIALLFVQMRMDPCGFRAWIILHRSVRPVPIAFAGKPQAEESGGEARGGRRFRKRRAELIKGHHRITDLHQESMPRFK